MIGVFLLLIDLSTTHISTATTLLELAIFSSNKAVGLCHLYQIVISSLKNVSIFLQGVIHMKIKDNPKVSELMKAIKSIETEEEALAFFEDLCTTREVLDFSERFYVANCLSEGMTYEAISQETKMSTATIARVNRSLQFGDNGYKTIIERLKHKHTK